MLSQSYNNKTLSVEHLGSSLLFKIDGEEVHKKYIGKGSSYRYTTQMITPSYNMPRKQLNKVESDIVLNDDFEGVSTTVYGYNESLIHLRLQDSSLNVYLLNDGLQLISQHPLENVVGFGIVSLEDEHTPLLLQLVKNDGSKVPFEVPHLTSVSPKENTGVVTMSYKESVPQFVTQEDSKVFVSRDPYMVVDNEELGEGDLEVTRYPNTVKVGNDYWFVGTFKSVKLEGEPIHACIYDDEYIYVSGDFVNRIHISGLIKGETKKHEFPLYRYIKGMEYHNEVRLQLDRLTLLRNMRAIKKGSTIPDGSITKYNDVFYINGEKFKFRIVPDSQPSNILHLEPAPDVVVEDSETFFYLPPSEFKFERFIIKEL